jgi:hypothetical protein
MPSAGAEGVVGCAKYIQHAFVRDVAGHANTMVGGSPACQHSNSASLLGVI